VREGADLVYLFRSWLWQKHRRFVPKQPLAHHKNRPPCSSANLTICIYIKMSTYPNVERRPARLRLDCQARNKPRPLGTYFYHTPSQPQPRTPGQPIPSTARRRDQRIKLCGIPRFTNLVEGVRSSGTHQLIVNLYAIKKGCSIQPVLRHVMYLLSDPGGQVA
jgi:hypothetical protein